MMIIIIMIRERIWRTRRRSRRERKRRGTRKIRMKRRRKTDKKIKDANGEGEVGGGRRGEGEVG